MDLDVATSEAVFRAEIRSFLLREMPRDLIERTRVAVHPSRADILTWQQVLATRGWSVPRWPVEFGGTGWSAQRLAIFDEEQVLAGAPEPNAQAISLVGPVIYTFGSPDQVRRWLPGIREGREFWCQGFSEPNSGSDLASLSTKAVRVGDEFVVNGQKIWTSHATMADMCFCLVRTDPAVKPQLGISFLLVPLSAPGVTVRPIRSIDGGDSLCEVFFVDVRVPAENLVGELGKGWDYAKFLLASERVTTAEVPRNKKYLAALKQICSAEHDGATPLMRKPVMRERIARAEAELVALEAGVQRAIDDPAAALLPSVLKLQGCALIHTLTGLSVEALGARGVVYQIDGPPHALGVTGEYLYRRAATIYGGSNEIQKEIIARTLFAAGVPAPQRSNDPETTLLRETVDRFVAKECGFEARRHFLGHYADAAIGMWHQLGTMGWLGVLAPEEAGGLGRGPDDMAAIQRSFGRALVVLPFLPCAVVASRLLATSEDERWLQLLASVTDGSAIVAPALDERGARGLPQHVATQAQRTGDGYRLSGQKSFVLGGELAETFLVSARLLGDTRDEHGIAVFAVPRHSDRLIIAEYRTIDDRAAVDLTFDGVLLDVQACVAAPDTAMERVRDAVELGAVGACAEAVGAAEAALALTIEYLKVRRQFGQTLSSFQALRHRVAEMYAELERARSALASMLGALSRSPGSARRRTISAGKAVVGASTLFVGRETIQLHGGIGMTEEYPAGHYLKRLMVLDTMFGDVAHHRELLAAEL